MTSLLIAFGVGVGAGLLIRFEVRLYRRVNPRGGYVDLTGKHP